MGAHSLHAYEVDCANRELAERIADAAMGFLKTVAPDGELRLPIAKPFGVFQSAVRRAYLDRDAQPK